jgi:hypothetical protein
LIGWILSHVIPTVAECAVCDDLIELLDKTSGKFYEDIFVALQWMYLASPFQILKIPSATITSLGETIPNDHAQTLLNSGDSFDNG